MDDGWYRLGMLLTLAAGIWEGPIAIIFRAFTDKKPTVLTAANYLPAPWCYLAAVAAAAAAFAVIAALETRRRKATAEPR
ncbi:hypothetical protein [Actinoplanes friuliensis]|uniref:Uncharacterized protein n=1 Tax=Actinoplanes friuliensis DSM 7358 TaxID=1246995 RepID=U5W050_9ACTN|nr:hypothetical protein [Actinoplanes friuliensis]AGZ42407.1 hypothetical protein AFR_20675 [Actinoplanes friuliensis DSM 7358]